MGKYSNLLAPGNIGAMEVKNRVVMAPMITHMANSLGEVTETMIDYYVRRAEGGVGYITVGITMGATAVDRVKILNTVLRADDDTFVPGLSRLAEAIHDAGAKAVIQLSPGAGAQASGPPSFIPADTTKYQNVSSSDRPSKVVMRQPRPLSIEEIEELVDLYGQSVLRVRQAGFDGVEIHGHGGYLLAQFLSPYFNKRTDKYGGDKENRFRILKEIIQSAKKYAGDEYPLIFRYSVNEFVEGGRGIEESKEIAKLCETEGVHAIHVSAGAYESLPYIIPPMYLPRGYLADLSAEIKGVVDIPVIVPGRINDPDLAEDILKEGKADFVALGRVLIADPDWPKKVEAGDSDGIRRCIACNEGCIGNIFEGRPLRCTMNATVGTEAKYDKILIAKRRKKIIVAGAGPAGMEAARVSALRGHEVSLYERSDRLGGQVNIAAIPPNKSELKNIIDYFETQFSKMGNVEIKLGTEVTFGLIEKEKPDVVVIATGSVPYIPEVKGVNGKTLVTAHDVLEGKVEMGNEVVVVGGGLVGCETANYLAEYCGKVTIVEMMDELGSNIEKITRFCLLNELEKKGVSILTGYKLYELGEKVCFLMDRKWNIMKLSADLVVFATGAKSCNVLLEGIKANVPETYIIGDAKKPRKIIDANREGYLVGYRV